MTAKIKNIIPNNNQLIKYCNEEILNDIQALKFEDDSVLSLKDVQNKILELFQASDLDGLLKLINGILLDKIIFKKESQTPVKHKFFKIITEELTLLWEFRFGVLKLITENLALKDRLILWKNISEISDKRLSALLLYGEQLLINGDIEAISVFKQALMIKSNNVVTIKALHRAYSKFSKGKNVQNDEFGKTISKDLKGKFCSFPFNQLEIHRHSLNMCCPAWMPISIGDPSRENIMNAWNSEKAHMIRDSILDGSYSYCIKCDCPYIISDSLQKKDDVSMPKFREYIDEKMIKIPGCPENILLAYDQSCNLACYSCRASNIVVSVDEDRELEKITSRIISILPYVRIMTVSGNGDPFFSRHYKRILLTVSKDKYPDLTLNLYTNGLLFSKETWEKFSNIHDMIADVHISIDAAKEETYNIVRKNGNWKKLLKNLDFIATLKEKNIIKKLHLKYVVQEVNFKEIPDFVKFAKERDAYASFIRMASQPHLSGKEFEKRAIFHNEHPRYKEFLDVLNNPILQEPNVIMGNLTDIFQKANTH